MKKVSGFLRELWYDDKQEFYGPGSVRGGKEVDGMRNKWIRLLLPAAAVLLLTGCLFRPPDDLYKLPEKSPGYEQLNSAIRSVRSNLELDYGTSCELAVIVGGEHTASIQLQDLDGDGERESAITSSGCPALKRPLRFISSASSARNIRSPAWWRVTAPPSTRWTMWT